jgi:hypothetical protein
VRVLVLPFSKWICGGGGLEIEISADGRDRESLMVMTGVSASQSTEGSVFTWSAPAAGCCCGGAGACTGGQSSPCSASALKERADLSHALDGPEDNVGGVELEHPRANRDADHGAEA